MTELPRKETPNLSEVEKKIEEYVNALQSLEEVSEYKERIADLVIEAFYPAEAGEQFWRWASEQIEIRAARKAETLAAAEVERKARILAEVKAFEDEHGPLDEAAKKMALANSQRQTSKAAK